MNANIFFGLGYFKAEFTGIQTFFNYINSYLYPEEMIHLSRTSMKMRIYYKKYLHIFRIKEVMDPELLIKDAIQKLPYEKQNFVHLSEVIENEYSLNDLFSNKIPYNKKLLLISPEEVVYKSIYDIKQYLKHIYNLPKNSISFNILNNYGLSEIIANKNKVNKIYSFKKEYTTFSISRYIINRLLLYLNYKIDNCYVFNKSDQKSLDVFANKIDDKLKSVLGNVNRDKTNLLKEFISCGNDIDKLIISVPSEYVVKRIYYLKKLLINIKNKKEERYGNLKDELHFIKNELIIIKNRLLKY